MGFVSAHPSWEGESHFCSQKIKWWTAGSEWMAEGLMLRNSYLLMAISVPTSTPTILTSLFSPLSPAIFFRQLPEVENLLVQKKMQPSSTQNKDAILCYLQWHRCSHSSCPPLHVHHHLRRLCDSSSIIIGSGLVWVVHSVIVEIERGSFMILWPIKGPSPSRQPKTIAWWWLKSITLPLPTCQWWLKIIHRRPLAG